MAKVFSENEPPAREGELCEKCEQRPRAKSHTWCSDCKAEAQSRYMASRDGMFQAKGFAQGVSALREALASEFARLGTGYFRGDECAALVRTAAAPVYVETQTP